MGSIERMKEYDNEKYGRVKQLERNIKVSMENIGALIEGGNYRPGWDGQRDSAEFLRWTKQLRRDTIKLEKELKY